jgi:hypothetical protein
MCLFKKHFTVFRVFLYHEHAIRCLLTIQVRKIIHSGIISSVRSNYFRANGKIRRSVTHREQNLPFFALHRQSVTDLYSVGDRRNTTDSGTQKNAETKTCPTWDGLG